MGKSIKKEQIMMEYLKRNYYKENIRRQKIFVKVWMTIV